MDPPTPMYIFISLSWCWELCCTAQCAVYLATEQAETYFKICVLIYQHIYLSQLVRLRGKIIFSHGKVVFGFQFLDTGLSYWPMYTLCNVIHVWRELRFVSPLVYFSKRTSDWLIDFTATAFLFCPHYIFFVPTNFHQTFMTAARQSVCSVHWIFHYHPFVAQTSWQSSITGNVANKTCPKNR